MAIGSTGKSVDHIDIIFQSFEKLSKLSTERDKINELSKIKDFPELKWIAVLVESKNKSTNVSYDYLYKLPCGSQNNVNFNDFQKLVEKLVSRQLTGNSKDKAIRDFFLNTDEFHCKWYKRILSKNLRINVGRTLFMKVIGLNEKDFGIKFKPMLATDFNSLSENEKHKLFEKDLKWIAEIKIDGLRMLTIFENGTYQCFSRNSKRLPMAEELLARGLNEHIIKLLQGYVLDGEFYNKNWSDTMSSLMRKTSLPSNIREEDMEYYVFDIVTINGLQKKKYSVPYQKRKALLHSIFKYLKPPFKYVDGIIVKEPILPNLETLANKYISLGWEGVIGKYINGIYEAKRSKLWIKFKKFYTIDVLCTGIIQSNKNPNMISAITFKYKGKICKCGTGFSDEQRKDFLKHPDKITGKIVELKYQEESSDGCLRFPTFVRIRLDKDRPDV